MIHAYFIGGSLDLTKKALPDKHPRRVYFAYAPMPLAVQWDADAEAVPTTGVARKKEVYALLGQCRHTSVETYIYEYDHDE